jgi:hypothetical protein
MLQRFFQSQTGEVAKVYSATIAAIGVSLTSVEAAGRVTLLALTIAYTAVKLYQAIRHHRDKDEDDS